jgi:uncharacterized protein (DUF362 family)
MDRTIVAIVKGEQDPNESQIDALVRKAVALSGGLDDLVSPGDTVIIKPNLLAPASPSQGATTDYRVCKSLADQVIERGGKPIIAEGSAIGADTEESIKASRYDTLRSLGYEVLDLKTTKTIKIPVPRGTAVTELSIPEVVLNADAIINVPKMKTHDQALATLCIKNMKGILPDTLKKKFHTTYGVFRAVAELSTVVKPALNVVDGIIAQEGLGPLFGTPVKMGLIIAGRDPVAVDTITALVMGIDPEKMETSKHAAQLGVGTMDPNAIDVVGEKVEAVRRRFKPMSEAMYEELHLPQEFELLFNEMACTGCRNGVLSTLRDLELEGRMDMLKNVRIVAGQMDTPPAPCDKRTIFVGICTAKHRGNCDYVQGCPPNNVDIISAITGTTDHQFFAVDKK